MSDIVEKLKSPATVFYEYAADDGALLKEAAAEIENLRARTILIPETVGKIVNEYPALRAENEKLRAALAFYADDDNWRLNGPLDANSGNFTGGPAAALKETGE